MFERIVTFSPAFDRRDPNPSKDYGIHGVELRMVLKGPLGATQFLLYTNWQLPHVTEEDMQRALNYAKRGKLDATELSCCWQPQPADRGYHWSVPRYPEQESRDCDILPSGRCYYDGSSLNAEQTYRALVEKGDEGVWADLEHFYHQLCKQQDTSNAE